MKKTDQLAKPGETGSMSSHTGSGDQLSKAGTCQGVGTDSVGEFPGHAKTQTEQSSNEGLLHNKDAHSSGLLHKHDIDSSESQLGATGVDLNKFTLEDS